MNEQVPSHWANMKNSLYDYWFDHTEMCGQTIHAGRESTEIMYQLQAELVHVFATKTTHKVKTRKASCAPH